MSDLNRNIIVFAVGGIAVLAVLWIVVMRFINKRDPLETAGPPAEPTGDSIYLHGRPFGLHTLKNAEGDGHWVLSLPAPESGSFSVHREDAFDWLADHVGLAHKVMCGDKHYDEEFEIRSNNEAWAKHFFSDAECRRLVQALFGLDCSAVILKDGKIQVVFEERDSLEDGAEALIELANRVATA